VYAVRALDRRPGRGPQGLPRTTLPTPRPRVRLRRVVACLDGRAGPVRPILERRRTRRPPTSPAPADVYSAHPSGALFPPHPARLDGVVVGGVLLIACGLALAWPTLRVIRAPRDRWIQGRSQWLLFMWARRGEAPPSASELRLWASIWLAVATILLGLGVALIASA
jgi:hypothetical protein